LNVIFDRLNSTSKNLTRMANADAVQILTSLGMPEEDARQQLENNTLDLKPYWEDVTDGIVIAIAERCPGLTSITLDKCEITDATLIALAEHCPRLTIFHLDSEDLELHGVTDDGVVALAANCPGLTEVTIGGMMDDTITDNAIIAVAENCPGLTILRLDGCCSHITDKSITRVAVNCPGLTRLQFYGVFQNITDTSMIALWQHCYHLIYIGWDLCEVPELRGITGFGDQLVDEIMKRARDLDDGTGPRCKGQMN
jgi:hypothetical protein